MKIILPCGQQIQKGVSQNFLIIDESLHRAQRLLYEFLMKQNEFAIFYIYYSTKDKWLKPKKSKPDRKETNSYTART